MVIGRYGYVLALIGNNQRYDQTVQRRGSARHLGPAPDFIQCHRLAKCQTI